MKIPRADKNIIREEYWQKKQGGTWIWAILIMILAIITALFIPAIGNLGKEMENNLSNTMQHMEAMPTFKTK